MSPDDLAKLADIHELVGMLLLACIVLLAMVALDSRP